jgi:hypothetical protein
MTGDARRSLQAAKQRQAFQVTGFLLLVAATALFYTVHGELVAYRRGEKAFRKNDPPAAENR